MRISLPQITVRAALAAAALLALASASGYGAVRLAADRGHGEVRIVRSTTVRPVACDGNGVSVRFDVRYERRLADYAVTAVRVVDLASRCLGQPFDLVLADASGRVLHGAHLHGSVGGPELLLPLARPVLARTVRRISAALGGIPLTPRCLGRGCPGRRV